MPHAHDIVAVFVLLLLATFYVLKYFDLKGWKDRLAITVAGAVTIAFTALFLSLVVAPAPPAIAIKASKGLRAGDAIYLSYVKTPETGVFEIRTRGERVAFRDDRGEHVLRAEPYMEIELVACRWKMVACIAQTLAPPVAPAPSSFVATGWNWQRSAPRVTKGWKYERSSPYVANPRRTPVAIDPHDWHDHGRRT